MIGLAEKIEGVLSELRNEARLEGMSKERRNIVNKLLEKHSADDVCKMLDIEISELTAILEG